MTAPAYTFLPWLRQGLANQVSTADGDPAVRLRPRVTVSLTASGRAPGGAVQNRTITKQVSLYGPADIVGIDPNAIVRTEPRPWITNAEPNLLPHVDFYDEDFLWRYTPATATAGRLRPWLTLLVLTEEEFRDGPAGGAAPLPRVDLLDLAVLPKADQLWAWAHVHVDRGLGASDGEIVSGHGQAVAARLAAALAGDPDLARSRLLCPRMLAPDTGYHAFLVPTFEGGRRAGLGLDVGDIPATMSAWATSASDSGPRPQPSSFPVYHRWYFRTGARGDFETLVRLLRPAPIDPAVGTRAIDARHPGSGVRGVDKPELGGTLRLGGALRPPHLPLPGDPFEAWDQPFPRPLQEDLARLINLADDYRTGAEADPVISPPLYGRWHALTARVRTDEAPDGWVRTLNLDPRFRIAAGLGAMAVRENQERYMQAAWDQIGQVLAAQRRIRNAQFGRQVSKVWHERHLASALSATQRALHLTAPLHRRILSEGETLRQTQTTARVSPALCSAPFRRFLRPRGRMAGLLPFDERHQPLDLLNRVNAGEVDPAPPDQPPPGVLVTDTAAGLVGAPMAADTVKESGLTTEWLAGLPGAAGFTIGTLDKPGGPGRAGEDSPEAEQFKEALEDSFDFRETATEAGTPPEPREVDLGGMAQTAVDAVDPDMTIPRRIEATVHVPQAVRDEVGSGLVEPMAYPVIDQPMYEPLRDLGADLFLPNANLIAPNTVTLLETDQRFIESYLVGANHEFARELLWREYPTDQRGSTFRQFWDVRGTSAAAPGDTREALRDIPPLHEWAATSALGSHDHRDTGGGRDELVLVIRGELLKRYPNAVVYAHRARWPAPGQSGPRQLSSDPSAVRTPRYAAKIDPDITILGFDLTAEEAIGGDDADADPGWYFVIKERPGEPRFGLDTEPSPRREVWNDLSWPEVRPGPAGGYLDLSTAPASLPLTPPAGPPDLVQHGEDVHVAWGPAMTAADLAYILFQAPVLVGVHAAQMLHTTSGEST
ncbi:hypothetical protein [Streptosporangium sp. CA-115845]|uniref:hypothetical protein n=1 Tax=Streptosporangium sp. CA-115845 TaxID=3240071 RepID=UPI003D8BC32C